MLTKDLERLAKIAKQIEEALANPMRQSMEFWRGDLQALRKAAEEVQKRK